MRVVKPSWVAHPDETRPSKPDLTIFSLDVHPDASRLATGGLDSLVRVWATQPILDEHAQDDARVPKLLSTLSAHTGALLHLASERGAPVPVDAVRPLPTSHTSWPHAHPALTAHSVVMSVRWNNAGSRLASGSDDRVVMIWSHEGSVRLPPLWPSLSLGLAPLT